MSGAFQLREIARRLSASSGELIKAFSRILDDETPDLMLVLGDRIEMLAPVYAATIQKKLWLMFMGVR